MGHEDKRHTYFPVVVYTYDVEGVTYASDRIRPGSIKRSSRTSAQLCGRPSSIPRGRARRCRTTPINRAKPRWLRAKVLPLGDDGFWWHLHRDWLGDRVGLFPKTVGSPSIKPRDWFTTFLIHTHLRARLAAPIGKHLGQCVNTFWMRP